MIAPMREVLFRELIRHFNEEGLEYVDKTAKRGGLYFFNEAEAASLKEKGYPVGYTENGTKGTNHRSHGTSHYANKVCLPRCSRTCSRLRC